MTDETLPPEDATADHEDAAEPALGGEVAEDPVGPGDLSPLERHGLGDVPPADGRGPEDVGASASTETGPDRDAGDGGEGTSDHSPDG